jgi:hypothetical protein
MTNINIESQEFQTEVQNAVSILFRSYEMEAMMSASLFSGNKFHKAKEKAKEKAVKLIMERVKLIPMDTQCDRQPSSQKNN